MENTIIVETALILLFGLIFGRLVQFIKMPNVTGYLLAGLLLGPAILNWIPQSMVTNFDVISDMALAFIAFTVGCGFSLSYFRKVGIAPIIIACCESFGAIFVVGGVLLLLGFDKSLALMMGAIAAATAPAQTIMVIKQYNAKGPLTSLLLSVVAIDDATALIGFGIATSVVKMMSGKGLETNLVLSLLSPLFEIGISILIGGALAVVLKFGYKVFTHEPSRLCLTGSMLLAAYWLANKAGGSALMSCMALGAVLVNVYPGTEGIRDLCDDFTPPLYMIFFTISGAGFQLDQLAGIGVIGILYVVLRMVGKMGGAFLGCKLTKQTQKVCLNLGTTLMPQAGVALGLIVVAGQMVPEYAAQIRTVILCSTFLYSLIGPVAAKLALENAGEIVTSGKAATADAAGGQ